MYNKLRQQHLKETDASHLLAIDPRHCYHAPERGVIAKKENSPSWCPWYRDHVAWAFLTKGHKHCVDAGLVTYITGERFACEASMLFVPTWRV